MPIDQTIQAKNYKRGRADAIKLVVLHSTESPCAPGVAHNVAAWFGGSSAPEASSHYVVGPDLVVQCVDEGDTAWHAPPVNDYSIGIEQTGRAAFKDADWQSEAAQAMLERSAQLCADICSRNNIPAVFVDADGLVRGEGGITTHVCVTNAFHKSDHTDPGPNFPIDAYMARVAELISAPGDSSD